MTASEVEREARLEARKAELWEQTLRATPHWAFSTALLWVAYRDFGELARWLRKGEGRFLPGMSELERIDTADHTAQYYDEPAAAVELMPKAALVTALGEGQVVALGVKDERRSHDWRPVDPQPIKAETWFSHRLGPWLQLGLGWDRARQEDEPFLLPAGWKWRNEYERPTPAWSNLVVDRTSLLLAFPELSPDRKAAWWPAPKARKGNWARPGGAAEAAARERFRKDGNTHPLESDLCEVLAAMWNEARPDDPTTKASLVTMRSNAR